MLRAIKIRLYPNKEQATMFNKLLGCYRVVYNQCLNRKIESYKNDGKSENLSTLGQFVIVTKNVVFGLLKMPRMAMCFIH